MKKSATAYAPPHWDSRDTHLNSTRQLKMARSAHAYVRGNTSKFYDWLESAAPKSLPEGPAVWICGDCHVGNLGPVANAEGLIDIQIRDFDQTVIGNPAHDVIRLALSLAMAARSSDLPGVTTARMIERVVESYVGAFRSDRKYRRAKRPNIVFQALRQASRRSWRHLSRERVAGDTVALPLGRQFWPVSPSEKSRIEVLFSSPELKALATQLSHRSDQAAVNVVDVAYWQKGCSSLGLLRYAVLLDVGGRAAKGRDLCLIDIKEATKAVAPRYETAVMPRDNAQRVLAGAKHMSPHLGERMAATRLDDRSVFIRELLPEDLKLELSRVTPDEAIKAAAFLAQVVGRAHARQLKKAERTQWQSELMRNHSKSLEAPSWLWKSVVDLAATHERSYLEHCRKYAIDVAA